MEDLDRNSSKSELIIVTRLHKSENFQVFQTNEFAS